MNVTSNRKRSLTLAALAMLASGALAAAPAHAAALDDHGKSNDGRSSSSDGGRQADQGVVQSVSTRAIVLKALDGSVFSIPVDGSTRFYVGDAPASLGDIKPGFVVTGKWKDGAAEEVRAFNPSPVPTVSTVSTVASVRADRIVVTAPDGSIHNDQGERQDTRVRRRQAGQASRRQTRLHPRRPRASTARRTVERPTSFASASANIAR